MKRKYLYYLFTLLFVLIIQTTLQSQTNSVQLKYLTKNSDAIITGKVVLQKAHWNENKTRIYTTATIQVDEYLKGTSQGSRIEVNYPGGEIDGVGELYTHTARLDNQEDVLLFIRKDTRPSQYQIFEGEEGKVSLHMDKQTGEKLTSANKRLSAYKTEIRKIIEQD